MALAWGILNSVNIDYVNSSILLMCHAFVVYLRILVSDSEVFWLKQNVYAMV